MLANAGISVDMGVCANEAAQLNAGFFCRQTRKRPFVTLKCASTIDGRIATRSGNSQWITGEAARNTGPLMRAMHDAVLVGSMTAMQDNPSLTCRLPGMESRSPVRIVLDGRMRLVRTHNLVATANDIPTWLVTLPSNSGERAGQRNAYIDAGVKIIEVDPDQNGHPNLVQALQLISNNGITRLMVEGGGQVTASFISARAVDEIVWFRAPCLIGGDGMPALADIGVDELSDAPRMIRIGARTIGEDIVEHYSLQD
jgi:diaminohydroxyphosphoribosylaminopyrimidine deaminase/5-amino-6-(5-phosphoribosylamino)uracil reductase